MESIINHNNVWVNLFKLILFQNSIYKYFKMILKILVFLFKKNFHQKQEVIVLQLLINF